MGKIEWTDKTWNPVIGCAKVSAGCKNCYAERAAHRVASLQGGGVYLQVLRTGTDERGYIEQVDPRWNGRVVFLPERLGEPLHWRKPRRVFVNSMSDLFHEDITFEQIAAVFGVMAASPRHTFQVLTKRPARMLEFFRWINDAASGLGDLGGEVTPFDLCVAWAREQGGKFDPDLQPWPLPNVHLGVSVEDQAAADERIPLLLQCPAALRFLSVEPLLGPVDLGLAGGDCPACNGEAVTGEAIAEHERACEYVSHDILDEGGGRCTTCGEGLRPCGVCGPYHGRTGPRGIGWVIVGGESGPGARPCDVDWIRSVVKQCRGAGVPVFVKQLGANAVDIEALAGHGMLGEDIDAALMRQVRDRKGADPSEWPEDLRVQEFPEERG